METNKLEALIVEFFDGLEVGDEFDGGDLDRHVRQGGVAPDADQLRTVGELRARGAIGFEWIRRRTFKKV